jgi:hypothetical protein
MERTMDRMAAGFEHLPEELWRNIFYDFSWPDFRCLNCVSKAFQQLFDIRFRAAEANRRAFCALAINDVFDFFLRCGPKIINATFSYENITGKELGRLIKGDSLNNLESLALDGENIWEDNYWNIDKRLDEIGKLTKLKRLSIKYCKIKDKFHKICKLTNLQKLEISNCKHIPPKRLINISKLINLCSISLRDEKITDKVLKAVSSLPALWDLDLSTCGTNEITVKALYALRNPSSLVVLDLSGCQGMGLVDFEKFIHIRALLLENTDIDKDHLSKIAKLANLQYLGLGHTSCRERCGVRYCNCVDERLSEIGKIVKLKYLDLSFCGLTGSGLVQLAGLMDLREIILYRAFYSEECILEDKALDKFNYARQEYGLMSFDYYYQSMTRNGDKCDPGKWFCNFKEWACRDLKGLQNKKIERYKEAYVHR